VGVNRLAVWSFVRAVDCPHARGGEPSTLATERSFILLSPRPWG